MNSACEQLMERLRHSMMGEYAAVNPATNPVAVRIGQMTEREAVYVIEQYTFFPGAIVGLLCTARDAAREQGWQELDVELTRNLGEELGTETAGIPHAEMLLAGLEAEMRMAEIRNARIKLATIQFLESMKEIMRSSRGMAYVAGAAYALEASAAPELDIVWRLIEELAVRRGMSSKECVELCRFFDLHRLVWEIGHEEGIRKACDPYSLRLGNGFRDEFEEGFRGVMSRMDTWWKGLAAESVAEPTG